MDKTNETQEKRQTFGRRPSFALFHPNAKGTGCGIVMTLHPAHDDVDGCIMLKMMPQKSLAEFRAGAKPVYATFDNDDPICVKLGFADLTAMLQVFRGETESIGEDKGLFHRSPKFMSKIQLRHMIEPNCGYALEVYRNSPGKPNEDRSAFFFMTSAEALGISLAIEDMLGVICFGIPQLVERDTSEYRRQVREARDVQAA